MPAGICGSGNFTNARATTVEVVPTDSRHDVAKFSVAMSDKIITFAAVDGVGATNNVGSTVTGNTRAGLWSQVVFGVTVTCSSPRAASQLIDCRTADDEDTPYGDDASGCESDIYGAGITNAGEPDSTPLNAIAPPGSGRGTNPDTRSVNAYRGAPDAARSSTICSFNPCADT